MKFMPVGEMSDQEAYEEIKRLGDWILHNAGFTSYEELALATLRLKELIETIAGEPLQRVVDKAVGDDGESTGAAALTLGWPYK